MLRPSLLVGAFLALGLAGCGGGGGGGSEATRSVVVSSSGNGSVVAPGGTLAFAAVVKGSGKVAWSVDGGAENGTISQGGLYTAPTAQGVYTVRATAGGVSGTKTVAVTNGISIALTSPTTVPLTVPRSKLTFAAAVSGSADKLLVWTASGGTIGTDGTFTAPDLPGSYTVTVASHADPTKKASATVRVDADVNVRIAWAGKGDLVLDLRPDKAPNTVANFVTLVNKRFYDGIQIHRKTPVPNDNTSLFQWGDPNTKTQSVDASGIGSGGPGYTIPFELNDLSNLRYTLGMARNPDKDSAGSQVYVNLVDQTGFDHREDDPATSMSEFRQGYVVFGAVTPSTTPVADALVRGSRIVTAKTEAVP